MPGLVREQKDMQVGVGVDKLDFGILDIVAQLDNIQTIM